MLTPYLVLGLPSTASTAQVRARYLELVRRHPPGKDPRRFQRIARAQEMLGDERRTVRTKVLGVLAWPDFELAIADLVQARAGERPSPSLTALLEAAGVSDD